MNTMLDLDGSSSNANSMGGSREADGVRRRRRRRCELHDDEPSSCLASVGHDDSRATTARSDNGRRRRRLRASREDNSAISTSASTKLRLCDVVLLAAISAKLLASALQQCYDDNADGDSQHGRMPFHSPLLYRRTDDDSVFDLPSYDYDDNIQNESKNVRFKGMLHKNFYHDPPDWKDHLAGLGYALVDDVIFFADDFRESTQDALDSSHVYAETREDGDSDEAYWIDESMPAFDFPNNDYDHMREHLDGEYVHPSVRHSPHLHHDDDQFDHYYAYDDDYLRGTLGMGMRQEELDEGYGSEDSEDHSDEAEGSDNHEPREGDVACTRPVWHRMYHPTCNEFHTSLSGYQWLLGEEVLYPKSIRKKNAFERSTKLLSRYLGSGYYRNAFLFQSPYPSSSLNGNTTESNDSKQHFTQWDKVVFKSMKNLYPTEGGKESDDDEINGLGLGYDPHDSLKFFRYKEYMRMDAMIIELLSSSPHAINIYSHCAQSSIFEYAPVDIEESIIPTDGFSPKEFVRRRGAKKKGHNSREGNSEDEHDNSERNEQPINDHISPEEKLQIALEMAEGIAALHGFKDGPIANVDVQLGQFFKGMDGKIKLVDYNRAEPLLWDEKNERYCRWKNGRPGEGTLRSPEENLDAPLTEKMDIFSLGNVYYSLLTGRKVWEYYDYEERIHHITEGIPMPIPESYRESPSTLALVQIIEKCFTYDAEERPDVFKLVEMLKEAVAEHPAEGT